MGNAFSSSEPAANSTNLESGMNYNKNIRNGSNSRNSALNVQVTEPPTAPTTTVQMPNINKKNTKNKNKQLNVVVQEGNKGVTINIKPNSQSKQENQPNTQLNNMAGGKRKSRRQSKKSKKNRSRKH